MPQHRVKFYRWRHNVFLRTTDIHNKYMYTTRAYYLQYCGCYAPHRRCQTPDDRRWTMDAGPSTPYYKLTGELKLPSFEQKKTQYFSLLGEGPNETTKLHETDKDA